MFKLYLASQGLPENYREQYFALFPGRNTPPKIAWIADAAEPYAKQGPTPWIDSSLTDLKAAGLELVYIRLQDFTGKVDELEKVMEPLDGVWIAGGNTHFIRYAMRISGFDQIIGELLEKGMVYAGESAGAMVAAPNIALSESPEELADVPEVIEEGLNLWDTLILPHWNREEYREDLTAIQQHHTAAGRKTLPLKDGEAVIIE